MTLLQRFIAGFDCLRKTQVRKRVLVRATDPGVGWQCCQLQQRCVHHRGVTLEDSPAAPGKKRVAAEEDGRLPRFAGEKERNVIERMSGHCYDPRGFAQNLKVVSRRHCVTYARVGRLRRAEHRQGPEVLQQSPHAACVVGVVVRNENTAEPQRPCLEPVDDGPCVSGVYREGVSLGVIEQPDVVVAERRHRVDLQHTWHDAGSGRPMI